MARTILERKTWSCELQAHALLTCAFYFEPSRAGAVLIRIGCGGRFYFEPSHAGAVLIRIGCGGRVVLPALYCQRCIASAVLPALYCQRCIASAVLPAHTHSIAASEKKACACLFLPAAELVLYADE